VRDPKFVERMAGWLVNEAHLCIQRTRRAVRGKKVAPAAKVDAEHNCFEIAGGLVQALQRLGYLPTAPQKVEADVNHHAGAPPGFATLRAELGRLKEIGQSATDPHSETAEKLKLLEQHRRAVVRQSPAQSPPPPQSARKAIPDDL